MSVCLLSSSRRELYLFFLVVLFNLLTFPLCAQIEPDFSHIKICQGDSFQLSNFIKYHVKVPVDYQLLGWKEGWLDWVAPEQTTSYHLQYARKNGIGGVHEFSFLVQVIPFPTIDLEFSHTRLCEGSEIRVPHVYCNSCDDVYWENLENGKRFSLTENLGIASGDYQKFILVATNEFCAMMNSKSFECEVVKPDDYRFVLRLNHQDTPLYCIVDLYYKGKFFKSISQNEHEDEFKIVGVECDSSLENYVDLKVELMESRCNNHFFVSRKIPKNQKDREKIKQQLKTSFHCLSLKGEGKLCLGSQFPLKDVMLRNIHDEDLSFTLQDWSDDYNHETYSYPFRYALPICGKIFKTEKDTFLLSILAKDSLENDFLFSDTLIVDRCRLYESEIDVVCKESKEQVWVINSSIDPVVNAELFLGEKCLHLPFIQSEISSDILPKKSVWALDYDLLTENTKLDLKLDFEGCTNYSRSWKLNLSSCFSSVKKLYFGAYTSPASILLKKQECSSYQCYSVQDVEPDTLFVELSCPDDELYLKFRLDGFNFANDSMIYLKLNEDLYCETLYPFDYQLDRGSVCWKADAAKHATIRVESLPDDGIISGVFGGVKFVYKVKKIEDFVLDSIDVCYGETIDLQTYIKDTTLKWNVENTKVTPETDREYYVYGVTQNGCIVDESLHVRVWPYLWWDKKDSVFCIGEQLVSDDILHSNAIEIFSEEKKFDNQRWIVERDSLLNIQLLSYCDTQTVTIRVFAKNCSEERLEETFMDDRIFTYRDLLSITANLNHFELSIYDRNGRLLRRFENKFSGWDGMYAGRRMQTDTYWFELFDVPSNQFTVGYFLWQNR
jgi:gliding motility-associated-like protein